MRMWRVTAQCLANVPTSGPLGDIRQTFYRGSLFDAELVDKELLELWQRRGLAEPVDQTPNAPAAPPEPTPTVPSTPPVGAAAVQTPPPTASVTYRSSKDDLVTYGVAQGDDEAELRAMTVKDLQARYLKAPEQK